MSKSPDALGKKGKKGKVVTPVAPVPVPAPAPPTTHASSSAEPSFRVSAHLMESDGPGWYILKAVVTGEPRKGDLFVFEFHSTRKIHFRRLDGKGLSRGYVYPINLHSSGSVNVEVFVPPAKKAYTTKVHCQLYANRMMTHNRHDQITLDSAPPIRPALGPNATPLQRILHTANVPMSRLVFALTVISAVLGVIALSAFGLAGLLLLLLAITLVVYALYRWATPYDDINDAPRQATLAAALEVPLGTNNKWLGIMAGITGMVLLIWLFGVDSGPSLADFEAYDLQVAQASAYGTSITLTNPANYDFTTYYVWSFLLVAILLVTLGYIPIAAREEASSIAGWVMRLFRRESVEAGQPFLEQLAGKVTGKASAAAPVAVVAAPPGTTSNAPSATTDALLRQVAERSSFGEQVKSELGADLISDGIKAGVRKFGSALISVFRARR